MLPAWPIALIAAQVGTSTVEEIVTATRIAAPAIEVPAPVTVLARDRIDLNPSQTIDGLVRSVPAAATFRRSSSLVADPTSQGLNLRGVGPSGVSRALVLLDGVPVNDPFGGWIYWRALPRLGIERIEVAPGGGSALWGSYALGGVVQIISQEIDDSIDADVSFGSFRTLFAGLRAAGRFGDAGAAIEGELLTSDGWDVVAGDSRGSIDRPADSKHGTLNARMEAKLDELELSARLGWFREDQNGGTTFTTADVEALSFGAGAKAYRFTLDVWGGTGTLSQTRARVAMDRSSETIASEQRVPESEVGSSLSYAAEKLELAGEHALLAGIDVRRVEGTSHEVIHLPSGALVQRETGGSQLLFGAYLQDLYSIGELDLAASIRFDGWRVESGEARTTFEWSPRLGFTYRPIEWLALRAAGYRAFRAPTLNELYRPFQVGTVRTAANDALTAEHLIGAEAGFDLFPLRGLVLRATGFWNSLDDPIVNATLDQPLPDGSERRRENLGSARILGAEASIELRLADHWLAALSYAYVHATSGGRDLPQDPRHRGAAHLAYDGDLFSASIHVRAVGPQFEDDRNELRMEGFAVIDVLASIPVGGGFEIFGAVENLLDQEYLVGRAGIDTIGQPRLIRAGVRLRTR